LKFLINTNYRFLKYSQFYWGDLTSSFYKAIGAFMLVIICVQEIYAQKEISPITIGVDQKITYNSDSLGNQIPDFSYAGYQGGNKEIPDALVKVVVPVKAGDATKRIQAAIDYVSKLPFGKDGLRGAVLLQEGEYQVLGSLKLHTSGVVLRGSGFNHSKTTILGDGVSRETLIKVVGINNVKLSDLKKVAANYVPVNAKSIPLENTVNLKVGDRVMITRPSTQEWINVLGTNHFGGGITSLGWKPNQRNVYWDRTIVAIRGNAIEIDAPITTALDQKYGSAIVEKYTWSGRIENVGVENIELKSAYNTANLKDEDHRWMAITIENAENVWVRRIQFKHFAGSAVYALETAKKVTVEDCISLDPVSEIGGQRRYTFYTKGQQTLFQRLYSEKGYHDFVVGYLAAGPNAFVQCQAIEPYSFSGAIDSWASGILFDVIDIDGQALSYKNRGQEGNGAGWTAANSVLWQISAGRVDNYQPPTAQNWAFGVWSQFQGNGFWDKSNEHIKPRSLYYAQLEDRIGKAAQKRTVLMPILTEASSSPQVAVAMSLSKEAAKSNLQLKDFILSANERNALNVNSKGVKTIDQIGYKDDMPVKKAADMQVINGRLLRGNQVLFGDKSDITWWSGSARPHGQAKARPHITRYVPGETGLGLTDDLNKMTDTMVMKNTLSMDHNYGLWYDRRRDDHERIRRIDGEVWPPFYELPFARSGQGKAYDGLSKYDLTKYNQFYWNRLKQFADLADEKGLVLIHQNYFQHNIIEAGAHYTDFPWRTANNINNVGFPEPVSYAGDKRIFMAEQFYDVTHPVRRELHRAYIRQCLNNFKENTGVIQMISAEYTGPLHFVEFWIDVIKEWKAETGKNPIIALSTTKDVQDAILADKERAKEIQVIDIKYWHYQADGTAYEPKGGQNLAPRQHARLLKPKKTSIEEVYRAVSEYKINYPDKAVLYHGDNYTAMAWGIFMAGGSMANLPKIGDNAFYKAASKMKVNTQNGVWMLSSDKGTIIYNKESKALSIDLSEMKGVYEVKHIDPKNGEILKTEKLNLGKAISLTNYRNAPEVIWISKK
jgi:ribosomal protein L28